MTKPDTRHLDTAIEILGGGSSAKRARKRGLTLHLFDDTVGVLQGPNGKTIRQLYGTPAEIKAQAQQAASKANLPLEIFE